MSFLGSLFNAIGSGIADGMSRGMEAANRSRNMSDRDLYNVAKNGSGWDKAAAMQELKERYGNK